MNIQRKFHGIEQIVARYELMSNPRDFLMVISILEQIKPKSILEAGTGAGAWPICLSKMGLDSYFELIDNFSYADKGFYGASFWPNNKQDLVRHLRKNGVNNFDIFDKNADEYLPRTKFDCVRIDLTETPTVIDRLINSLIYNGIIFIDDIHNFNRLSLILQHDNFYPIWVGEKEGAWTRDANLHSHLVDTLKNIHVEGLINEHHIHKKWFFCVTKKNSWHKENFK